MVHSRSLRSVAPALYRIALGGLVLILPVAAVAQTSTAAIHGTMQDATGAVIPEAKVVLTNVDTGVERRTVSNNASASSVHPLSLARRRSPSSDSGDR